MCKRQRTFCVRPCSSDQFDPFGACPLAGNQTNTACRRVEQHPIPALNFGGAAKQVMRGQTFQHHCRALLEGNRIWQRANLCGRHDAGLGIGPGRLRGIGHAVAFFEMGHTCANRLDNPCGFHTQSMGQRHWIQARALININEIQPNGFVADFNLARLWVTHGPFNQLQDLRSTMCLEDDGFCQIAHMRFPLDKYRCTRS